MIHYIFSYLNSHIILEFVINLFLPSFLPPFSTSPLSSPYPFSSLPFPTSLCLLSFQNVFANPEPAFKKIFALYTTMLDGSSEDEGLL